MFPQINFLVFWQFNIWFKPSSVIMGDTYRMESKSLPNTITYTKKRWLNCHGFSWFKVDGQKDMGQNLINSSLKFITYKTAYYSLLHASFCPTNAETWKPNANEYRGKENHKIITQMKPKAHLKRGIEPFWDLIINKTRGKTREREKVIF